MRLAVVCDIHGKRPVLSAARRAEDNGRGDCADALRSGHVGRLEKDVIRP